MNQLAKPVKPEQQACKMPRIMKICLSSVAGNLLTCFVLSGVLMGEVIQFEHSGATEWLRNWTLTGAIISGVLCGISVLLTVATGAASGYFERLVAVLDD